MPLRPGLLTSLKRGIRFMKIHACCIGHLQPTPYKRITERPPPGHLLVAVMEGPLPRAPTGHVYLLTFTKLPTGIKFVYLFERKSKDEHYVFENIVKMQKKNTQAD